MILCGSMAEVQPHHIDPCCDHLFEQLHLAGGGAQGGNNLGGSAQRHEQPLSGFVIRFQFLHESSYRTTTKRDKHSYIVESIIGGEALAICVHSCGDKKKAV
jgi:hypothetical protein